MEDSVSDCESVTSYQEFPPYFGDGLMRMKEDEVYHTIKKRFISGLGLIAEVTKVEAIHRNVFSSFITKARFQSFNIFKRAIGKKIGGDANVKFAWYGASKDEIGKIVSHGFGHCGNGILCGVHLSAGTSSVDSVKFAVMDENGLRHMLLCHVILGKMELVHPVTGQCLPSREEFDSGVDNLESPKKYIVWSSQMNTHILPVYVISFRAPYLDGQRPVQRIQQCLPKPTSPWMPFSTLIVVLSKFLAPTNTTLISNHYNDFRVNKISRQELVRLVRQIAGDELLKLVIRSFRNKKLKESPEVSPSNCSHKGHHGDGGKAGSVQGLV